MKTLKHLRTEREQLAEKIAQSEEKLHRLTQENNNLEADIEERRILLAGLDFESWGKPVEPVRDLYPIEIIIQNIFGKCPRDGVVHNDNDVKEALFSLDSAVDSYRRKSSSR